MKTITTFSDYIGTKSAFSWINLIALVITLVAITILIVAKIVSKRKLKTFVKYIVGITIFVMGAAIASFINYGLYKESPVYDTSKVISTKILYENNKGISVKHDDTSLYNLYFIKGDAQSEIYADFIKFVDESGNELSNIDSTNAQIIDNAKVVKVVKNVILHYQKDETFNYVIPWGDTVEFDDITVTYQLDDATVKSIKQYESDSKDIDELLDNESESPSAI